MLTGDVEICRRLRRYSKTVSWPTRVPAAVVRRHRPDHQTAVRVNRPTAGPRGCAETDTADHRTASHLVQRDVDAVVVPAVGDVVRVALRLTRQLDAGSLLGRRVGGWHHNVRITCQPDSRFQMICCEQHRAAVQCREECVGIVCTITGMPLSRFDNAEILLLLPVSFDSISMARHHRSLIRA